MKPKQAKLEEIYRAAVRRYYQSGKVEDHYSMMKAFEYWQKEHAERRKTGSGFK